VNPDNISTGVLALVYYWHQHTDDTTEPSTTRFERAAEIKKERPVRNERTDLAYRDLIRMVGKFEES
jgi:uncharacterized membrane protein